MTFHQVLAPPPSIAGDTLLALVPVAGEHGPPQRRDGPAQAENPRATWRSAGSREMARSKARGRQPGRQRPCSPRCSMPTAAQPQ
jgi:hypothetical protein